MGATHRKPGARARGVSPTLAAILLIMVTVGAAFLLYSYMQSQVPSEGEEGPVAFARQALVVEQASGEFVKVLPIAVSNPGSGTLSDYPVKILLDAVNFGDWDSIGSEGVYFVDNLTTMNPLPYWVQRLDTGARELVAWVRVPSVPAGGGVTIYMVYNVTRNPYEGLYSWGNVVYFYDGAEDGVDGSPWGTQYGGGQVLYSASCARWGNLGLLKTANSDPNGAYKSLGLTLNRAGNVIVLEFWVKRVNFNGGPADRVGLIDGFGNGYGWIYNHGTDRLGVDRRDSYSGTIITQQSVTPDPVGVWYYGRFYIFGNGTLASEWLYSGNHAVVSTSDLTYNSFDNVYIFGGQEYCVDEIIVRKGAWPEPTTAPGPSPSSSTIVSLFLKNPGERRLTVDKVYVKDLSTKGLVDEISYNTTINPGETKELRFILDKPNSGYLEITVTTKEGARARALLTLTS